jgi:tetratricopeptide (TPR) repeat protein
MKMSLSSFLRMACVCLGLACTAMAANVDPAALVKAGHFKQARVILEKRIAENAKDADALVLLARVRLAYEDYEQAANLLQQALDIDPTHSDAHVYMAEAYSQKIDHVGVFEKSGIAKKIKSEAERALAGNPKNLDAMETLMEFHLEAPGIVGGSKDKAREIAEKIASLDPVRGNFAWAEIAAKEKRHDEREKFLVNAVAADPQSYDALTAVAALYLRDRWLNYRKAGDYAGKAAAVDPGRVRAYALLARACAGQEQWTALEQVLAKAEREVPDNYLPYFAAGNELLLMGKQPARAETYFRKYLKLEPEGEAPSLPVAHWHLGLALEKQGRKQEAIQEIQTALKMKPGLKEAQKDLKRIKG